MLKRTVKISLCLLWCVYCVPCCVQSHTTRHAVHSLKFLLAQRRISYNDVLSMINSTIS